MSVGPLIDLLAASLSVPPNTRWASAPAAILGVPDGLTPGWTSRVLGPNITTHSTMQDLVFTLAQACASDCATLPCSRVWVGELASAGTAPGLPAVTVRLVACVPLPATIGGPAPHFSLNASWHVQQDGPAPEDTAWTFGLCASVPGLGCGPIAADGSTRCVASRAGVSTPPPSCSCANNGWRSPSGTDTPIPSSFDVFGKEGRAHVQDGACALAPAGTLVVVDTADARVFETPSFTQVSEWVLVTTPGQGSTEWTPTQWTPTQWMSTEWMSTEWALRGFLGPDSTPPPGSEWLPGNWTRPGIGVRIGQGVWHPLDARAVVTIPFRVYRPVPCCLHVAGEALPNAGVLVLPNGTAVASIANTTQDHVHGNGHVQYATLNASLTSFSALNITPGATPDVAAAFPWATVTTVRDSPSAAHLSTLGLPDIEPGAAPWNPVRCVLGARVQAGTTPLVHVATLVAVGTRNTNSNLGPIVADVLEAVKSGYALNNNGILQAIDPPWNASAPVATAVLHPDTHSIGGVGFHALHAAILDWATCTGGASARPVPAEMGWTVTGWTFDPSVDAVGVAVLIWASASKVTLTSPPTASGESPFNMRVVGESFTVRWDIKTQIPGSPGAALASLSSGYVKLASAGTPSCGPLTWRVAGDGSGPAPTGTPLLDDRFLGWFTGPCVDSTASASPTPSPTPTPVSTALRWAVLGVACPAGTFLDVASEVCVSDTLDCNQGAGFAAGPCASDASDALDASSASDAADSLATVCPPGTVVPPETEFTAPEACIEPTGLCGAWGYPQAPQPAIHTATCVCWEGAEDEWCSPPTLDCGPGAVVPAANATTCVCDASSQASASASASDAEPGLQDVNLELTETAHAPGVPCVAVHGFPAGLDQNASSSSVLPSPSPSPSPGLCGDCVPEWGTCTPNGCECRAGRDPRLGCVACPRETQWNGTWCGAVSHRPCGPQGSRTHDGVCVCAPATMNTCNGSGFGLDTGPCCVSPAGAACGVGCGAHAARLNSTGRCACVPGAVGAHGSMAPPCELVVANPVATPRATYTLVSGNPSWLIVVVDWIVALGVATLLAVLGLTAGRVANGSVARVRHSSSPKYTRV